MNDKILFKEEWFSIKQHNGYSYIHEEKCNGELVTILPYRNIDNKIEYLMRYEIIPPQGDNHQLCGVVGGCDNKELTIFKTMCKELIEETGYEINDDKLIYLDWVYGYKASDTKIHLFTVDLTNNECGIPLTDGTELEKSAYCEWMGIDDVLKTHDPMVFVILKKMEKIIKNDK